MTAKRSNAGRKANAPTPPAPAPAFNEVALQRADEAAVELSRLQDQVSGNAHALAQQLGYEGALTVDALEDQVRSYQRRSVEAVMGLGASLLLLKELTPHGQFAERLEQLGIYETLARRFMSAALKFSNRHSNAVLKAAGSQTKLLELLALDDDELDVLSAGGTARGITLERIDKMSVRELKEALRQSEKDAQFEAEKRQKAESRADTAEKKLRGKQPHVSPLSERITPFQLEITERQSLVEKALLAHMEAIKALDAWWTEEVAAQPGYDPEAQASMPPAVQAVLLHLADAIERTAHLVGTLQHGLQAQFGDDIASARQYLMRGEESLQGTEAQ